MNVPGQLRFPDPEPELPQLPVEVVRSTRRRRTISAQQVGGVLRISMPASTTKAEEEKWVGEMQRRFRRKRAADIVDLPERAARLADRHRLPRPASVRWVDNQTTRWGSCTPQDGSIRISSALAELPTWVLDYVLVHELAHLAEPGHDRRFWALVDRYPRAERARGYLMAKSLEPDEG
ncbi:MAG: family peptidase [Acidimicrobiales bacterium]|jgi:predicted metal-dependent hydrolase|nr:family peptidase [Acidimicrobiales bacterium]